MKIRIYEIRIYEIRIYTRFSYCGILGTYYVIFAISIKSANFQLISFDCDFIVSFVYYESCRI